MHNFKAHALSYKYEVTYTLKQVVSLALVMRFMLIKWFIIWGQKSSLEFRDLSYLILYISSILNTFNIFKVKSC